MKVLAPLVLCLLTLSKPAMAGDPLEVLFYTISPDSTSFEETLKLADKYHVVLNSMLYYKGILRADLYTQDYFEPDSESITHTVLFVGIKNSTVACLVYKFSAGSYMVSYSRGNACASTGNIVHFE